jgi:hypothetical protein
MTIELRKGTTPLPYVKPGMLLGADEKIYRVDEVQGASTRLQNQQTQEKVELPTSVVQGFRLIEDYTEDLILVRATRTSLGISAEFEDEITIREIVMLFATMLARVDKPERTQVLAALMAHLNQDNSAQDAVDLVLRTLKPPDYGQEMARLAVDKVTNKINCITANDPSFPDWGPSLARALLEQSVTVKLELSKKNPDSYRDRVAVFAVMIAKLVQQTDYKPHDLRVFVDSLLSRLGKKPRFN